MKKPQSEYNDLYRYEDMIGNVVYYKKGTNIIHNPSGPAIYHKASSWEGEYIQYMMMVN